MSGALVIAQERLGQAGLEALAELGADVALVICPDSELNRRIVAPADLRSLCARENWPCLEVGSIEDSIVTEAVCSLAADLLYVIGWSEIIPAAVLNAVQGPHIGFHGTLLPRHRGCAPIPWAIIYGLCESGMTMFHLTEGIDNGPIVGQVSFPIGSLDTATDLYDRSCQALCKLLLRYHGAVLAGAEGEPQDERLASYWPRRRLRDGLIDWTASAARLSDFVRALTRPFPGAFTWLGEQRVTVWAGAAIDDSSCAGEAGAILGAGPDGVDVATGRGVLRITEAEFGDSGSLTGLQLAECLAELHGTRFSY